MRPGGDDGRLRTPQPVRGKRVGGMNHRERRGVGVVTVRVRVSVGDVDAMVKMVMLLVMMMIGHDEKPENEIRRENKYTRSRETFSLRISLSLVSKCSQMLSLL